MRSSSADVCTNSSRPVALDPRARRAFGLEGLALAQPGTILVGLAGEQLRVREDGGIDPVLKAGHPRPGIAADPTAIRGGARSPYLRRACRRAEVRHDR